MPLMMLAMTANSGAGVDFVRMSATICEVAGSLPPVTRVTSMLSLGALAGGRVRAHGFSSSINICRASVEHGADPQDLRRLRELGAYARPAVVAGLADLRREDERLGVDTGQHLIQFIAARVRAAGSGEVLGVGKVHVAKLATQCDKFRRALGDTSGERGARR